MLHLRKRCDWRVVVGEPLEKWPSIHRFWRLRWKLRYSAPVAKHHEATESSDDIRLGFPGDLIAMICISFRPHIEGGAGRTRVSDGSGPNVLHPDFRQGLIG